MTEKDFSTSSTNLSTSNFKNITFSMSTVEIAEYFNVSKKVEEFSKRKWHAACFNDLKALFSEIKAFRLEHQHSPFDWTIDTLEASIALDIINAEISEADVQKYFILNIDKFIPNGKIINGKKSNAKHIPDFYIIVDGFLCVGEIKLNKFTEKSKSQLRRYMGFYNAKYGYAVASSLNTSLDTDMSFIKIDISKINR